ncbi:MAG: hypothetical protein WCB10_18500 [Steroidobacteraceae bacterium]
MPPQPLSCSALVSEAKRASALEIRLQEDEALTTELRKRATVSEASLQQQGDLATHIQSDLKGQQVLIGTTMKVVTIHQSQLTNMQQSLGILQSAYKTASDTIGANNKQLDSMIADLNSAFTKVQQQLDVIVQRLSTIK